MSLLKKDLYNIRFALIILIIYCIFMQINFGSICPLKGFLNISCPACGLTHATISLFTLNFKKAIYYNPTVFIWIPTIILWAIDRYIHNIKIKPFPYLFIITGIITVIWYGIYAI
jgi:hypothetical protein